MNNTERLVALAAGASLLTVLVFFGAEFVGPWLRGNGLSPRPLHILMLAAFYGAGALSFVALLFALYRFIKTPGMRSSIGLSISLALVLIFAGALYLFGVAGQAEADETEHHKEPAASVPNKVFQATHSRYARMRA